jgi:hypothetical protein
MDNFEIKQILKKDLQKCESLKEIIATMDNYYNIDKKLGVLSKACVIRSLDDVIKICNLTLKNGS